MPLPSVEALKQNVTSQQLFLWSVAAGGKDGNGLKLKKRRPFFQYSTAFGNCLERNREKG